MCTLRVAGATSLLTFLPRHLRPLSAMAKKKRKPERRWRHRRVHKSDFLESVRQRLLNDVGPYFEAIERVRANTGKGVGFWALARMLSVVEAVATILYRTNMSEKPPVRLLRELSFEYPNLVWEMYRHTLMHNDEMASASYMGRRITWCIGIGNGHSCSNGEIAINGVCPLFFTSCQSRSAF